MPYYVDVLTPSSARFSIEEMRTKAKELLPEVDVVLNEGTEKEWEELIIWVSEDDAVCTISCTPFTKGESDDTDLGWMIWDIGRWQPGSGAEWLRKYLPSVTTTYRFRFLSRAYEGTDNRLTSTMINWIHEQRGGIVRADEEGYTNEYGHFILWQFSDGAKGRREFAVCREDGSWDSFIMELGNPEHRAAFKAGRVPDGVEQFSGRRTELTE